MSRKDELQIQLGKLHAEYNAITDAEDAKRDAAYIGKCFRTRNNYSCPQTEKDYWWLYTKVLHTDSGLCGLQFQIDCNGRIEIEPDAPAIHGVLSRYEPISQKDFDRAWAKCVAAVAKAKR